MIDLKGAVLRVVKGTRMVLRIADDIRCFLTEDRGTVTVADRASGFLADALFMFSGERLTPEQDFTKDSRTMDLLCGNLSDDDVADELIRMHEQNGPCIVNPDEMKQNYRKNGGYMFETPEGDWT